jgi:hypothetical protein
MKSLAVVGLVLVASCATEAPKSFPLPDGRAGYTAHCDGNGLTLANCYALAANFCGGPYEVIGQDQASRTYGSGGNIGTSTTRSLIFTCEVAPAKSASQ